MNARDYQLTADDFSEDVGRWLIGVCRTFAGITPMNVWDLRIYEWRALVAQVEHDQREARRHG